MEKRAPRELRWNIAAGRDAYGRGMLPLVVPLTLVRQFAIAYLQAQTYLEPHPKELMLRNHV